MANKKRPKVGIGVMVFKDGKVLLSKRKGSHGAGEYAFPGGHLKFGESYINCAKRETKEECGIEIKNVKFLCLSNLKHYKGKHYVHIGLIAEWKSGEPRILEPEKSKSWQWYQLDNLPQPIFKACQQSFEAFKSGKNFFDS